jgi:transposase
MKVPGQINYSEQELSELMTKLEQNALGEKERKTLMSVLSAMLWLVHTLTESKLSIKRLKKIIFGGGTEKSSNILKEFAGQSDDSPSKNQDRKDNEKKIKDEKEKDEKVKGHGRNGKDQCSGADSVHFTHKDLNPGDKCSLCLRGKMYPIKKPGSFLLISGSKPVTATLYSWDLLRCNACGEMFKPEMPEDVKAHIENRPKNGAPVFDNGAKAMMALLRYGAGFPSYRLQTLQEYLKVPIPTSTQWDKLEEVANVCLFPYREIVKIAADGDIIYNDDTTMKVLSLMKEIEKEKEQNVKSGKLDGRTGIFTTGIVSRTKTQDNVRDIVLFFTGRQHAGENLNDLLKYRDSTKDPPIQMCDALSRNEPKDFDTETCNCNVHARRGFVDIVDDFDEALFVIEQYKEVYKNDAFCKQEKMNDDKRLDYHQQHSKPVMAKIIKWCNDKLNNKEVEPNSSLGGAMKYMQNHWNKLTKFLKIPGAPLDTNDIEQKLKMAILHRKNSLFYRTDLGSKVGDIMMSLIHTCVKSGINPLDYLIAIQDHAKAVFKNPQEWLPWNYQEQL